MNTTIETITKRKSHRTFDTNRAIEPKKLEALQSYMRECSTEQVRVAFAASNLEGVKLGTYGVISGASGFLVGITKGQGREVTIALGEIFERVILKATELGLSTCWMAGTYNKNDFIRFFSLTEEETVSIVSPVGYAAIKRKKRDRLLSFISQSHKRKEWQEIFFEGNWETPLSKERAGDFEQILEMVRIAPSSSNKQPWRLVVSDKTVHLYVHSPSSMTFRGFTTGYNDLGIVKSHIDLTAASLGIQGVWSIEEPVHLKQRKLEYIASWTMEG